MQVICAYISSKLIGFAVKAKLALGNAIAHSTHSGSEIWIVSTQISYICMNLINMYIVF